ncbi:MAG: aldo/keto reductase, partial [Vulcanimicrobiaceae bacterium]
QLAIAWVLSRGDDIVPLVGSRTRKQLQEALLAGDVRLAESDLRQLESTLPAEGAAGARYAEAALTHLDSER